MLEQRTILSPILLGAAPTTLSCSSTMITDYSFPGYCSFCDASGEPDLVVWFCLFEVFSGMHRTCNATYRAIVDIQRCNAFPEAKASPRGTGRQRIGSSWVSGHSLRFPVFEIRTPHNCLRGAPPTIVASSLYDCPSIRPAAQTACFTTESLCCSVEIL